MAIITSVQETQFVNSETGEVTSSEKRFSWTPGKEPDYVKVYLKDILYLKDMPASLHPVLLELCKRATSAESGLCIYVNAGLKKIIAKKLGYKTPGSVSNAICKLSKGDLLIRIESGVYILNPYLFGKGSWTDIEKIRMSVSYSIAGKSFNSVLSVKDEQMTFDDLSKNEEVI